MAFHRLVNKADFERLLASRSRGRSAHFALHHVSGMLSGYGTLGQTGYALMAEELSTELAPLCPLPVDKMPDAEGLLSSWFGCVVPKRHARRAVTRNLLKRQLRSAFARHAAALPAGLWLLRLRAPFSRTEFVSARSAALAATARAEIDRLLLQAVG